MQHLEMPQGLGLSEEKGGQEGGGSLSLGGGGVCTFKNTIGKRCR